MIAIENVRLFNETREALEQQTATAEVLKVIAARRPMCSRCSMPSPSAPSVLCKGAWERVTRFDGDAVHLVAFHGAAPRPTAIRSPYPLHPGRTIRECAGHPRSRTDTNR